MYEEMKMSVMLFDTTSQYSIYDNSDNILTQRRIMKIKSFLRLGQLCVKVADYYEYYDNTFMRLEQIN
jgi:archaellum biogenesis ATPase FlaH